MRSNKNNSIINFIFLSLSIISCSKKNSNSDSNIKNKFINTNQNSCIEVDNDDKFEKVKNFLKSIISISEFDELDESFDWYLIKKDQDILTSHDLHEKLEKLYRKYHDKISALSDEKHLTLLSLKDEVYGNIKTLTSKANFIEVSGQPSFNDLNRHDYSFEKYYSIYEASLLTKNFSETISDIARKNNISSEYFPLLEDFNDNSKELSFMNKNSHEIKYAHINSSDEFKNIFKFKKYLNDNYNNLRKFKTLNSNNEVIFDNIHGTQGLTAAIVIQTIIELLDKRSSLDTNSINPNLSSYIKAHTYVNIAILGEQILSDTLQTTELVKALTKQTANTTKLLNSLSKVSSVASTALNFASIGLSITELIKSESTAEKIQFGAQLGFDTAGLIMGLGNLALYQAGATTASAAVSALAVPLAGLSIGFTGFAAASAQAVTEAEEIADRFNQYKLDFQKFGEQKNYKTTYQTHSEIKPLNNFAYKDFSYSEDASHNLQQHATNHDIVVSELNLKEQDDKIKILFGTHFLYETKKWKEYGGIIFNNPVLHVFGDNPVSENDVSKSISLNNAFQFNSSKIIDYIEGTPIILPMAPSSYISYGYNYTPGIIGSYSAKFTALREIQEKNFRFMFTFFRPYPLEYAIRSMTFNFQNTDIDMILGDKNYAFFTPIFPDDWKNKINYKFSSGNGSYYLKLSNFAKYEIESSGLEKWFFDCQDLDNNLLVFGTEIKIGKTSIKFKDNKYPKEIILLNKEGVYKKYDFNENTIKLMIIDNNYTSNIKEVVKSNLNLQIQNKGYIEIENFNQIKDKKAWYEIETSKIIAPTAIENGQRRYTKYTKLNQNLIIIGKDSKFYYFYNPIRQEIYTMPYSHDQDTHNNPLDLLENSISEFHFANNSLFYKTKSNLGVSVSENIKSLISLKISEINPEIIRDISKEYNLEISQEVLVFDENDHFIGWYIKEKNLFISKELKDEFSFKDRFFNFFKNLG